MESINKIIDALTVKYENFVLIADLSVAEFDTSVENVCDIYSFRNLIKEPTLHVSKTHINQNALT